MSPPGVSRPPAVHQPQVTPRYSTLKQIGFALLIIIGIGGILAAAVGFSNFGNHQGWWSMKALSHLSQVHTAIMMGAGGGGGVLLLIVGIVGTLLNQEERNTSSFSTKPIGNTKTKDTSPPHIFGKKELEEHFGIIVKDAPPQPDIDWDGPSPFPSEKGNTMKDDFLLILMPAMIDDKTPLTIMNLKTKGGDLVKLEGSLRDEAEKYMNEPVKKPYWVLITKKEILNSVTPNNIYSHKLALIKKGGADFKAPKSIEVMMGVLAEYFMYGTKLYSTSTEPYYTLCEETAGLIEKDSMAVVGAFSDKNKDFRVGMFVGQNTTSAQLVGMAAAYRYENRSSS